MKFFLSAILLFFYLIAHAQTRSNSDSLEIRLGKMPDDTSKINSLISVAHKAEISNPAKAIAYSREALEISRQLHSDKGVTQSLHSIGRGYLASGDLDSSLYYFRESLAAGISENDDQSKSRTLMNIGTVFRNKGIYDSATLYYHLALSIAEKTNDPEIMASCLNNLGNVLKNQG
ncbi:MAG TPA: tetratricopeptide repeat protein, partial [Chitinophagales bacterium]|nr:tetratricopeptide repeat protein [Chitinophagales bacterium]